MIEREILGCILKDNSLINDTIIQIYQFETQANQLLFQSMKKLSMENKAIDRVTLMAENYKYIQQMGGPDFISSLESQGIVDNFESYERKFVEQYKKRESKKKVKEWLSKQDGDADKLVDVLQSLSELDVVDEVSKNDILKELHDLPYKQTTDNGIMSGLTDLDNLTGGFQDGSSYIVGARPSTGKTALMLKFGLTAMYNDVIPVMFSLEMSKDQLLRRLISTVGNINLFLARNPHELSDGKKRAWQKASNELYNLEFEIFDKSMQTLQYMRSQIRKIKRKHEGKRIIVMIDYLTLIHSDQNHYSDHARVSEISKGLKNIARDYSCPVITLAQLSRALEKRENKRPMLSDLRESGSIEEDGDGIMFLYRDSYYDDTNESNELEINLAKHRNGPTGTATIYYQKETGKMGDLSAY